MASDLTKTITPRTNAELEQDIVDLSQLVVRQMTNIHALAEALNSHTKHLQEQAEIIANLRDEIKTMKRRNKRAT